jgi:hypothetical protein
MSTNTTKKDELLAHPKGHVIPAGAGKAQNPKSKAQKESKGKAVTTKKQ